MEPFASQYETLRWAALGEPLAPESRRGLVLFLRRGMWGWVRAQLAPNPKPPTRLPSSSSSGRPDPQAVIQVLAAMALPSQRGRAQ
jgi:hypothetical protein